MISKTFGLALATALLLLSDAAAAEPPSLASLPVVDPFMQIVTVPLWEGPAPGAQGGAIEDRPTLSIFRPAGRPNGTAVIVAPGGSYMMLASQKEGRMAADWFAGRGVTAFVLKYRLGPGYPQPTPLLDAQRAVRWVRAHAAEYDLVPSRLGMMGFSAGGHLAARSGVNDGAGDPTAIDPVDRQDGRPDFLVMAYPALSMFGAEPTPLAYCKLMKLQACDDAYLARFRPEGHVDARTPPTFLYHTTEDTMVPASDSLRFYEALTKAGVNAELHIFAHGQHGSGLGSGDLALDAWPALLESWLRGRGLMAPNPNPKPAASAPR
jgi:acetyl esterase/lipase